MRKEVKAVEVICDICNADITDYRKSAISVANHEWDLCQYCAAKVQEVLTFLTITIGMHIPYKWMKQEKD